MDYETVPFALIAGWFFIGAFLLVFYRAKPEAALLWPCYAFVFFWVYIAFYLVLFSDKLLGGVLLGEDDDDVE